MELEYENNTDFSVKGGKWGSGAGTLTGGIFTVYRIGRLGQIVATIGTTGLNVGVGIPIAVGIGVCSLGAWVFKKLRSKYD